MKILLIAPDAFPVSSATGGSVEICLYQIGRRLAAKDQVTIISRTGNGLPRFEKRGNLTIRRVPPGSQYLKYVVNIARKSQWDIIQVDNRPHYIPVIRKHFPRSPVILNLHSLLFMSLLSKKKQREAVQKSTAILCNSFHIRNTYIRRFPSFAAKFHAIHLGTDLSRFRVPTKQEKAEVRARYKLNAAYHILSVGRVIPSKGIHLLVKAAGKIRKKYPHIRLLVAGPLHNARYRRKLKNEARKANLDMRLLGSVSPASVHRLYWLGDVFVFPTQCVEAFGLVAVEAMASGLPVIASHRGGLIEVLGGARGLLVANYRESNGYAAAIEQLIQNPAQAKAMALRGRQFASSHFSWDAVASNYRKFYKKVRKG